MEEKGAGERKYAQCNDTPFRASALFPRPAPLFCILFSGKTETGPKQQTSGAFAVWRGRAAKWTSPAACGGARDMQLARTSRRRHSYSVPVKTALRCNRRKASCVLRTQLSPRLWHGLRPPGAKRTSPSGVMRTASFGRGSPCACGADRVSPLWGDEKPALRRAFHYRTF